MRVRKARHPEPTRVGSPVLESVDYEGIAPLITLDDPHGDPMSARGAFARLRPPDGHPEDETRSWRDVVAGIAIAARVVPNPRRAAVPRPAVIADTAATDIREEAMRLARETGDVGTVTLVETILDEVQ